MALRTVARIVDSVETLEGAGFTVHRPFPTRALPDFDPFLLLDEMGPMDLGPGQAKGAPDHPHRGFETVTYMLAGRMQHRDSAGNAGTIGPGDVQWMTAGGGVVHSEMPDAGMLHNGGRMHGFQLWVNLPRRDKMMAPRYQEVPAEQIPEARTPGGAVTVRVIAGESLGKKAVIDTRTPIIYLHFTISPGAAIEQPVPPGFNAFAYVVEGTGAFGSGERTGKRGQMLLFSTDGEFVRIANSAGAQENLNVLLLGGTPLGEPVVRHGPFVMNTREEIAQAMEDFRAGRMGKI